MLLMEIVLIITRTIIIPTTTRIMYALLASAALLASHGIGRFKRCSKMLEYLRRSRRGAARADEKLFQKSKYSLAFTEFTNSCRLFMQTSTYFTKEEIPPHAAFC